MLLFNLLQVEESSLFCRLVEKWRSHNFHNCEFWILQLLPCSVCRCEKSVSLQKLGLVRSSLQRTSLLLIGTCRCQALFFRETLREVKRIQQKISFRRCKLCQLTCTFLGGCCKTLKNVHLTEQKVNFSEEFFNYNSAIQLGFHFGWPEHVPSFNALLSKPHSMLNAVGQN